MGFEYRVQSGDSLWDIAQKFYGDGNLWPRIYDANRGVIGVNFPFQVLYIP
jgi:nucleoid-associated protein YgaU